MFRRNINFKLTLGFLTIVIISTLIIGTISLDIFRNNIYRVKKNNMIKHSVEISKIIVPYLSNQMSYEEYTDIIKVIDSFVNSKVWVVDSNNKIVTASKTVNPKKEMVNSPLVLKPYLQMIDKSLKGQELSGEFYNSYYGEKMITTSVPIIGKGNRIIGTVLLHSGISDLSKSMMMFFIYLLLALMCEILLAGLMGYYFSKNITKPIKKINNLALEMSKGRYGVQTKIKQNDEIGELSNSFDKLSQKLSETIGQLIEEKTKLGSIMTSMNEGIIAFDKDFSLININNAARELLHTAEEADSAKILSILDKLDITQEITLSLKNNQNRTAIKKNNNISLKFSISPIVLEDYETMGTVILIQDISEEERLEQMRRDFISNVSHEFRTPLTIIRGNLESIIDGIVTPYDSIENCRILLKETNRLERMVRDLLDLSRLEAGKLEINPNSLDINMLIKDTVRSLKPLLNVKNISLVLDLSDNLPMIISDYDRLKQLLIIFLDNSIKFTNTDGKIIISTMRECNLTVIKIMDNGIGIHEEELNLLGERFYKVDKSRSSSTEGVGLGISIAKQLTKLLNCSLQIESKMKEGTTITLKF